MTSITPRCSWWWELVTLSSSHTLGVHPFSLITKIKETTCDRILVLFGKGINFLTGALFMLETLLNTKPTLRDNHPIASYLFLSFFLFSLYFSLVLLDQTKNFLHPWRSSPTRNNDTRWWCNPHWNLFLSLSSWWHPASLMFSSPLRCEW
jgi:hypothetical protein